MAEYKDRILLSFIVLLCMHEKEKEAMTPAWYSKKTQELLACEWSVGARVCFLPIVCVCVCVHDYCLCVRERGRERKSASQSESISSEPVLCISMRGLEDYSLGRLW